MEKLSVQLWFGVSLCIVVTACSSANCDKPVLKQDDLYNPKAITKALGSEISGGCMEMAKRFFLMGVKYQPLAVKDGNWGPVGKSFGESAIYYPRPLALKGYAEAVLYSIGAPKYNLEDKVRTLNDANDLYKGVLAADEILHELNSSQSDEVKQNLLCIEKFLQDRQPALSCRPLQWLRLERLYQ